MKIDVIIPVYKPTSALFGLLDRLKAQTVKVNRIILMNTEEKYFENLVYGTHFQEEYGNQVTVYHLSKREFDHGRTRNQGVLKSDAEVFVMMTQDAIPADNRLLEALTDALKEEKTAVAYARQLPSKDCSIIERYTRRFNYPERSVKKTAADLESLGVKTYFCSNVCAAYKRSIYDDLGGFIRHTIFNEDMIYAAKAIQAGFAVTYAADAKVIHSHNYSNTEQLKRNFDLGVSQADHPEVFAGLPSEKEGKKLVLETGRYLWKSGKAYLLPYFYIQCACKYTGYLLGRHYRNLPRFLIEKCTMNKYYWR